MCVICLDRFIGWLDQLPIINMSLLYDIHSLVFLQLCQWMLYRSSFQPDILCYNLLIDAFGHKLQHMKAEATYLELLEARCIPTEDTYALMLRAYCASGLYAKAEAIFSEMRKYGLSSSRCFHCICLPHSSILFFTNNCLFFAAIVFKFKCILFIL